MPDASGSRRDTAHFVNAIKHPLITSFYAESSFHKGCILSILFLQYGSGAGPAPLPPDLVNSARYYAFYPQKW